MSKASIVRRGHRCWGRTVLVAVIAAASAAGAQQDGGLEPLASIRAAAESQVRAQLHGIAYEVQIQATGPDARLHLARCPASLTTLPVGGAQFGAHVSVRVSCPAAGAPWAVFVPVTLESQIPVLVLRQTQIRGTRLSAADVSTETRRVPGLGAAFLGDTAALAHRSLNRGVAAGTALTADLFDSDVLIRQGQAVTLVAAVPGIEVRAPGRALEDAREGAHVRVQNLASQKVVQGVVDGSGLIYATP
ncbi:MAG: flagellar basal body P-ring formation protein FlgA [Proteobacteria bacterium]|nr:flagellar basal body P-ring formation protein FlgA [Pseudomonadota bacterium]